MFLTALLVLINSFMYNSYTDYIGRDTFAFVNDIEYITTLITKEEERKKL